MCIWVHLCGDMYVTNHILYRLCRIQQQILNIRYISLVTNCTFIFLLSLYFIDLQKKEELMVSSAFRVDLKKKLLNIFFCLMKIQVENAVVYVYTAYIHIFSSSYLLIYLPLIIQWQSKGFHSISDGGILYILTVKMVMEI